MERKSEVKYETKSKICLIRRELLLLAPFDCASADDDDDRGGGGCDDDDDNVVDETDTPTPRPSQTLCRSLPAAAFSPTR